MPDIENDIPAANKFSLREISANILIFCTMFFATWGSGLQQLGNFDLSRIFPFCAVLLTLYVAIWGRKRIAFPLCFNLFILFYLLHMFVTYGLFFPNEIIFSSVGKQILNNGFVSVTEGMGLVCLRFIIFVLFGYAVASLSQGRRRVQLMTLAYSLGLLLSLSLGGYSGEPSADEQLRVAGGYLNPNALGLSGLTAICLAAYSYIRSSREKLENYINLSSVLIGIAAIGLSASRGAVVGLICGFIVFVFSLKRLSTKIRVLLGTIFLLTMSTAILPDGIYRSSLERGKKAVQDRGSGRLDIWGDYLAQFPTYALTGVGFGRSMEVIKTSYTHMLRITHNNYLQVLVENGLFGLLLFMLAVWQLWVNTHDYLSPYSPRKAVLRASLAIWLTSGCFMNSFAARDTWIILGVLAGISAAMKRYESQ